MTIARLVLTVTSFALIGSVSAAPLVFVASDSSQFGTVDIATGAFQSIASQPVTFYSITSSANGLVGITDTGLLLRIDPTTGQTTLVGDTGLGDLTDVTASLGGNLFTLDTNGVLYTVNAFTGAATTVGTTGVPTVGANDNFYASLVGLGGNLYFTLSDADRAISPSLYVINPLTANATLVGPTADFIDASVIVNGTYYAFANTPDPGPRQIIKIDPVTGNSTFAVNQDAALTGVFGSLSTDAVPEPGTVALVCAGLAAIGIGRRRRT